VKLVLVAVGTRVPAWADAVFDDYAKRLPPELRLELKTVKAEARGGKSAVDVLVPGHRFCAGLGRHPDHHGTVARIETGRPMDGPCLELRL